MSFRSRFTGSFIIQNDGKAIKGVHAHMLVDVNVYITNVFGYSQCIHAFYIRTSKSGPDAKLFLISELMLTLLRGVGQLIFSDTYILI